MAFWIISLNFHNRVFKTCGSYKKFYVWLGFQHLFPSLKTQKFELKRWKQETANGCFQRLRKETQWHQRKYKDSVGPINCLLSCQFKNHVILLLQIWAKTISHFPQNISAKIFPLSHFPLSVFSHISSTPSNLGL